MPSKSAKQHRFMELAAHDAAFAKAHGIDQKVAREFVEADRGKSFESDTVESTDEPDQNE